MNTKEKELEVVIGSGNVYQDFGCPDADVRQDKAILAAQIIDVLDKGGFTVRKAGKITGIAAADFSRIRNAKLGKFSVDDLAIISNGLRKIKVN